MAEVDTRSWWSEVEHLREPLERRSGALRTERRAAGEHASERRTIKIRGQAVKGAPRRELREATPHGEQFEPYDIETAAVPRERGPEIRGRTPPRRSGPRRPAPRPRERIGSRPDRIAGWAVLFVLLMALIAATSAHGATVTPGAVKTQSALVVQAPRQHGPRLAPESAVSPRL